MSAPACTAALIARLDLGARRPRPLGQNGRGEGGHARSREWLIEVGVTP